MLFFVLLYTAGVIEICLSNMDGKTQVGMTLSLPLVSVGIAYYN